MLLIAFTLALLVIVSGMKLMAQTQKESLGNMYKYVSWFVVIMGFLCLMGAGIHGIIRCHMRCHERMENRCDMYENEGCEGNMMYRHHGMMGERVLIRRGDGCNEIGGGNCNMGGSCNNMGGSCNQDMEQGCNMGSGGSCPMMKDGKHCEEKDSVIVEKKEMKK